MNIFRRILSDSLPIRAWLVVGVISLLAISTASTSAILAWVAKADAKAINSAGMMRMATYRIDYLLAGGDESSLIQDNTLKLQANRPVLPQLIEDMQSKLDDLQLYQASKTNQHNNIDHQVTQLRYTWYQKLKPAILYRDDALVYQHSMNYINQVNQLTSNIQKRNESRQQLQQTLQMSALFLIIIMMMLGMRELKYKVLQPLDALMQGTKKFKKGAMPSDVQMSGYREFLALGASFNSMMQIIREHQNDLQTQVAKKTAHLLQVNKVLTLLYDFANAMNQEPVTMPKLHQLLAEFSAIIPQFHLSLCLHGEQTSRHPFVVVETKDRITLHGMADQYLESPTLNNAHSKICTQHDCQQCPLKNQEQVRIFEIRNQQTHWGDLMVLFTPDYPEQDWVIYEELLHTLVHLIGIAFNAQKQRQQEHQLVLLEERNTIARELHDSIAQSLSYLKIQLSMIGTHSKHIHQTLESAKVSCVHRDTLNEQHKQLEQVLIQARNGLNSAYTQLRELLVTFRLKIDAGSFDLALQQACDEFAQKGNFQVSLSNRVLSLNMTAGEQIDLLQIARESLSNIQRHAQANQVSINLFQKQNATGDQLIHLVITDDGVGLKKDFDQTHHHGLMIMQERANSLGGHFLVTNRNPRGTQVQISFLPKFFQKDKNVTDH